MLHVSLRADVRSQAVALAPEAGLTTVERQLVGLSLHDDLATVLSISRLQRLLQRVFAIRPANRLPDPQLELLRAFCVCYLVEGQAAFFRMPRETSSVRMSSDTISARMRQLLRSAADLLNFRFLPDPGVEGGNGPSR